MVKFVNSHLVVKFGTNSSGDIWWLNLQLIQVVPSGGHVCNQCKWCHLVVKYGTNASGTIWWANLQLMQLAPSGGQIWNQSKWCTLWPNWQPMQVAPSGGQSCNQFKKFHWNQFQTILVERFYQVIDSIPWVRCASGNVCFNVSKFFKLFLASSNLGV